MSQKKNTANNPLRMVVAIVVVVAVVGVAAFALWNAAAGTGEPTQNVAEVVPTLEVAAEAPVYEIQQEGSEARFLIDEVLRGAPFTVVGVTNQVAGQMTLDLANPANTQLGTILINARSLQTDASQRNNALRNFILRSADDAFELITFEPTALSGLPEAAVAVGEEVAFQITGNLTIVETTREVTFDVTVTLNEDNTISGLAVATVLYADFNLTIPSVPFVASVEDDVRLELQFVAAPATE
jgi:polyisoprenoid-binding protein YceI